MTSSWLAGLYFVVSPIIQLQNSFSFYHVATPAAVHGWTIKRRTTHLFGSSDRVKAAVSGSLHFILRISVTLRNVNYSIATPRRLGQTMSIILFVCLPSCFVSFFHQPKMMMKKITATVLLMELSWYVLHPNSPTSSNYSFPSSLLFILSTMHWTIIAKTNIHLSRKTLYNFALPVLTRLLFSRRTQRRGLLTRESHPLLLPPDKVYCTIAIRRIWIHATLYSTTSHPYEQSRHVICIFDSSRHNLPPSNGSSVQL